MSESVRMSRGLAYSRRDWNSSGMLSLVVAMIAGILLEWQSR